MIGTLTGKYFYGIIHAGKSEVHGFVVEEVGRDSMFLLVRYFDWNTHDVELRLTRVVRLDAVLDAGWRFFQTKQDLLDWLKETDSDTFDNPLVNKQAGSWASRLDSHPVSPDHDEPN